MTEALDEAAGVIEFLLLNQVFEIIHVILKQAQTLGVGIGVIKCCRGVVE